MKIYTKRGDLGETDLFGGERVLKCHYRVKAYGSIDMANSSLGLALAEDLDETLRVNLIEIMKILFCAGSEVATSEKQHAQEILSRKLHNKVNESHVVMLEKLIDAFEEKLEPLRSFILPFGCKASASLHFARTMVRQAEANLVEIKEKNGQISEEILRFFNRLSDLLFVWARYENHRQKIQELTWSGSL